MSATPGGATTRPAMEPKRDGVGCEGVDTQKTMTLDTSSAGSSAGATQSAHTIVRDKESPSVSSSPTA
eukprot:420995-Amphidinium_carterae.1